MARDEVRTQQWIDRIEELVRRAESISDPTARGTAVDLLEAVLAFHAAGLERLMEIAASAGKDSSDIIEQIATDDLTSSMLLLHDLHPDDLDTRIHRAIERLQEMFASLGAKLSLVAIEETVVRLQFESSRTWAGTPVRDTIENAIFQAAPEIESVRIEGLKETPPANFVPVADLLAGLRV
ncbi:MAG: NifU family protein [Bryobacteraceae bacterium]